VFFDNFPEQEQHYQIFREILAENSIFSPNFVRRNSRIAVFEVYETKFEEKGGENGFVVQIFSRF
jgi:hypothetical protein